jgi:hypothetical protein
MERGQNLRMQKAGGTMLGLHPRTMEIRAAGWVVSLLLMG